MPILPIVPEWNMPVGGDEGDVVTRYQGGVAFRPPGSGGAAGPFPFFGAHGTSVEWSRPSLETFSTWINQTPSGLSAATATEGAGALPIVLQGLADGVLSFNPVYTLTGKLKSIGAPPWEITVAMAGASNLSAVTGVAWHPLILRNSISDKAISVQWTQQQSPASPVQSSATVIHWENASTGASATRTQPSSGSAAINGGDWGWPFSDYFNWLRIANDGTNLTFWVSQEGILFLQLPYSETLASFITSVDQVGFGFDRANLGGYDPNPAIAGLLWNWVES